jgi:DNA repair exonuclease SbcCD ATPase subunit
MRIQRLLIKDILSVEELELSFDNSGLILLDGWNYDDDTANGAGKTSVWNALSFGLYGKMPRKVTTSQIVRRGKKSGRVEIDLEIGGRNVSIKRCRPKKEEFTVDGKPIANQEELESLLRMSYSQFLMCMYVAQKSQQQFIDMNDSDKKDFFLDLLGLDKFDTVKSEVDDHVKSLSRTVDSLLHDIDKLKVKKSTLEEYLEDSDKLSKEIEELETFSLEAQLAKINVSKPDLSDLRDLKSKIKVAAADLESKLSEISVARGTVKQIDSHIKQIQAEIGHDDDIECPHCQEHFILSGDNAVTADEMNAGRQKKIDALNKKRLPLVKLINSETSINVEMRELQKIVDRANEKHQSSLEEYHAAKSQAEQIKSAIQMRQRMASSKKNALDRAVRQEQEIHDIMCEVEEKGSKLAHSMRELEIHKTLQAMFSPTGVAAYVLDGVIDTFTQKVTDYMSIMWPNASYSLLSYRENKNGTIKAKMSDEFVVNGEKVSLGSLSGGELKCLSLAIDFAALETMEQVSGISINPYILDEPFDSLDASNRERAVEMLDRVSQDRQVWVVDHQSEAKALFSDIVKVEKRNGISKLVS